MIEQVQNKLCILIIESCDLVRIGLHSLFENHPLANLVVDTNCLADLMFLAKQHQPNIVIIDHQILSNIHAHYFNDIKQLSTQSKVLVLTEQDNPLWQLQILQMGITGFVSKYSSCKLLLNAITAIHAGKTWLNRSTILKEHTQIKPGQSVTLPNANHNRLSKAESTVASLACQGLSAKEIGSRLSITEQTVRNQLSVIYKKVGVRKQVELCIKAQLQSTNHY